MDIAGLVKGASKGEGLGNKFLSHIREVDAVAEVVRVFEDPNIIHIDGNPDPVRDIQVINLELILTDLETATKRLASIERDVKKGDKGAAIEKDLLTRIREFLESERMASGVVGANEEEKKILETLQLLTTKPIVYVLNQKSGSKNVDTNSVIEYLKSLGSRYVFVDAGLERDLGDLGEMNEEEKKEYRVSLGAGESGVNELIKKSYETLNLITYFTTGEDETRAWTILRDSTAPIAGTAIHTDFKDKFIRAEVVHCDDLLSAGSYANAREKGLVRTEGKEYIVKDGDVIEFRI